MKLTSIMKKTLNGRYLTLGKANIPSGFKSAYITDVAYTTVQRPASKPIVHKIPKKG